MKTFYLNECNEEVVFELYPDGSVEKVWPHLAITDLNEKDLIEWLEEDVKKGLDSRSV